MSKFLIVDDDPATCRFLAHCLARFGESDQFYDGQDAINAFRSTLDRGERYALVSIDILMPGTDGHQVLEAIRAIEDERGIQRADAAKVIMITSLKDPEHCMQAFRDGCEAYLTKPLDEEYVRTQASWLLSSLTAW